MGYSRASASEIRAIDQLPENSLLRDLPAGILDELLPHLETVRLTAGKYLNQSSVPLEYLYFPETAVISEIGILKDGRTVETALLGREAAVGLGAVLSNSPASCGIKVLIDGDALQMKACVFRQAFKQSEALQTIALHYLNDYARQLSQNICCYLYHSVEQRMCRWLLALCRGNNSTRFLLTQERIAECLGVHRPSVTQVAQKLQHEGTIKYWRGKLFILDSERLRELSCECCRPDGL